MAFSLYIALLDIKTGMVPRIAFIAAFPFFLALNFLRAGGPSPAVALTGAIIGLLVFLLAFFVSGKKLGLADVWYSAFIGAALGPLWWYTAMGCACIAGAIYILASRRRQIPFIPLMAIGSVSAGLIQGILFFSKIN